MCGRIARETLSSPLTLVSIMRSQSSGSPSCSLLSPAASPALLRRMSGTASSATSSAAAAFTAARSRTSTWLVRTVTPCPHLSSEASLSSRSSRRAQSTRLAPSAAKRRAQDIPMPELAPVMSASLPVMRFTAGLRPDAPQLRHVGHPVQGQDVRGGARIDLLLRRDIEHLVEGAYHLLS